MKSNKFIYINNEWTESTGREYFQLVNPATEKVISRVSECTEDDVQRAVSAASRALSNWSRVPLTDRCKKVLQIAAQIESRADEIAYAITEEMGSPISLSSDLHVGLPLANIETFVQKAREIVFEQKVGHSQVVKTPVGVVACITPWNYPLHQVIAKVVPALLAGCTVVLKPSEVAPRSALILAEIIDSIGFPPGTFNLVTSSRPEVSQSLVKNPNVNMVSFTGSTETGRQIMAGASNTIKRIKLELGGKSAAIILDESSLEGAIGNVLESCFMNSGQTCFGLSRLLVPDYLYSSAKDLILSQISKWTIGDPADPETVLGPIASEKQFRRVISYIKKGLNGEGELISGESSPGSSATPGFYVKPTVFRSHSAKNSLAQDEIFGPVLVILTFKDEQEAIDIANDTPYGLAAAVWCADSSRAYSVASKLDAGMIDINGADFNFEAPFGGFKQSGIGRENGIFGIEEFLELKSIQLPDLAHD